jgi:hypothetical protein
MYVNDVPYDCDVGEIAGGAQRQVTCSPVGDSGRRPVGVHNNAVATPCAFLPGPPCPLYQQPGGMRAPCLNLADDQGC